MENTIIDWVISIAGIIFGGGMIGQLIQFFVKRHDAAHDQKLKVYIELYSKLTKYKSLLENSLLASFKHISDTICSIQGNNEVLKEGINEVQTLMKKLKYKIKACYQKTGFSQKNCSKNNCNECKMISSRISELFEILDKEQDSFKQTSLAQSEYWKNNYEHIYNVISDNLNIHDILHLAGQKDKKLLTSINNVDIQTRYLFKELLTADGENVDFQMGIQKQLKNIEHSLVLLSKKFN